MARVPEDGDPLSSEDVEMIFQAIQKRQENFKEPAMLSAVLVMLNIGNRFAVLTCLEEEWSGFPKDVPPGEGEPKCPNGHPLRKGPGMRLVWVTEEVPELLTNENIEDAGGTIVEGKFGGTCD